MGVVLIIFLALFAYSGVWPPLVVVESNSMQHSDARSSIGVIDTGDLVIVKKAGAGEEVITYVEGVASRHMTYEGYGDVVIYSRYGQQSTTPIIHRAICRLVYNSTGGGFDIPSLANLPPEQWNVPTASEKVWWDLKGTVEIYDVGYLGVTVRIDLKSILQYFGSRTPHGGLITMGDHNIVSEGGILYGYYDQISIFREPVLDEWIVGKARGELPWFGLLKLWVSGDAPATVPENSKTNLFISIALIVGLPIALDLSNVILKRRGIEMFAWTRRLDPRRLFKKARPEPKEEKPASRKARPKAGPEGNVKVRKLKERK